MRPRKRFKPVTRIAPGIVRIEAWQRTAANSDYTYHEVQYCLCVESKGVVYFIVPGASWAEQQTDCTVYTVSEFQAAYMPYCRPQW